MLQIWTVALRPFAASNLETGVVRNCDLAASVNLEITPNKQSALLAKGQTVPRIGPPSSRAWTASMQRPRFSTSHCASWQEHPLSLTATSATVRKCPFAILAVHQLK